MLVFYIEQESYRGTLNFLLGPNWSFEESLEIHDEFIIVDFEDQKSASFVMLKKK